MTQIAVDDKIMQKAIASMTLPDAESVIEKALRDYIFDMKSKAELLQEYSEDWPWSGELSVPIINEVLK
ncbi:MAG: type II toxin-antitoxin system VapB family antitoxin [Planctomycetaceae bacterium]|jgi:Arc/MetJ family transcription regulator|nr:type II toxin-antitoxin system VapB family antitoxin [Planctomycetaceae bacterium]